METVKLPPNSVEAEMAILGALFLDNEAIKEVDQKMLPNDFYREIHRTIYKVMLALAERSEPCDLVTVTNELKSCNMLSDVGGGEYLAKLVDFVPTANNLSYYIEIVKNKSMTRKLINSALDIVSKACNNEPLENVLDFAEKAISLINSDYADRPMPTQQMIRLPNFACVRAQDISYVFADHSGHMADPVVIVGMRTGREFAYQVSTDDEAKEQVDGILRAMSIMQDSAGRAL